MSEEEARKLIDELSDEEVLILREMLLSLLRNRQPAEPLPETDP